jgi:hypothetical protein
MWVADDGIGPGRRLLNEVEDYARSAGAPALRLETNSSLTEAIALYRSVGGTSRCHPATARPSPITRSRSAWPECGDAVVVVEPAASSPCRARDARAQVDRLTEETSDAQRDLLHGRLT